VRRTEEIYGPSWGLICTSANFSQMDSNLKWTLEGPYMKANPQCNAPKEITLHPDKSDWMDNLLTGLATVSTLVSPLQLDKKPCWNETYET
jgi:hypothetical protein